MIYINTDACSEMFAICGQPCLSAGGGVIKKGEGVCYFEQTHLDPDEVAVECARKECPVGAIRIEEEGVDETLLDDEEDF